MSIGSGELKEILRQVLREQQAQAPPKPSEPAESQGVHTSICPNCYKETIAIVSGKGNYQCHNCKLPMGNAKMAKSLAECPRCHSTHSADEIL